jgi:hypothetical protein
LADVLDVDDKHSDAREHEHKSSEDRDARYFPGSVTVVRDLAEREHRVDERCNKEANSELARLVLQDAFGRCAVKTGPSRAIEPRLWVRCGGPNTAGAGFGTAQMQALSESLSPGGSYACAEEAILSARTS